MKVRTIMMLGLALLVGCGQQEVDLQSQPPEAGVDSRITVDSAVQDAPYLVFEDSGQPPAEVKDESWSERRTQTGLTLDGLSEYAKRVDPDDGFALTETEIDELAKKYDEVVIY